MHRPKCAYCNADQSLCRILELEFPDGHAVDLVTVCGQCLWIAFMTLERALELGDFVIDQAVAAASAGVAGGKAQPRPATPLHPVSRGSMRGTQMRHRPDR